ncbi:MAG: hypothetical protein IPK12_24615 [Gemmatimonadetes bacterium]|nr:hypothetical protein [Gemmatimonadota bacterium]
MTNIAAVMTPGAAQATPLGAITAMAHELTTMAYRHGEGTPDPALAGLLEKYQTWAPVTSEQFAEVVQAGLAETRETAAAMGVTLDSLHYELQVAETMRVLGHPLTPTDGIADLGPGLHGADGLPPVAGDPAGDDPSDLRLEPGSTSTRRWSTASARWPRGPLRAGALLPAHAVAPRGGGPVRVGGAGGPAGGAVPLRGHQPHQLARRGAARPARPLRERHHARRRPAARLGARRRRLRRDAAGAGGGAHRLSLRRPPRRGALDDRARALVLHWRRQVEPRPRAPPPGPPGLPQAHAPERPAPPPDALSPDPPPGPTRTAAASSSVSSAASRSTPSPRAPACPPTSSPAGATRPLPRRWGRSASRRVGAGLPPCTIP